MIEGEKKLETSSHGTVSELWHILVLHFTLTYKRVKTWVIAKKVGRLKPIWAVPPLKVGRLEPSHGDRFRRHWAYIVKSRKLLCYDASSFTATIVTYSTSILCRLSITMNGVKKKSHSNEFFLADRSLLFSRSYCCMLSQQQLLLSFLFTVLRFQFVIIITKQKCHGVILAGTNNKIGHRTKMSNSHKIMFDIFTMPPVNLFPISVVASRHMWTLSQHPAYILTFWQLNLRLKTFANNTAAIHSLLFTRPFQLSSGDYVRHWHASSASLYSLGLPV